MNTAPYGQDMNRRRALTWIGALGLLLTFVGMSGLGDGPNPTQSADFIAQHFKSVSNDVLLVAPAGYLGAVLVGGFIAALARRLHAHGEKGAAWTVISGGTLVTGYFLLVHLLFTILGYEIAWTSAEATKTLFVASILAMPLLGLGVALVLGGAAHAAHKRALLPRWWVAASAVGAAISAVAIFSYARSEVFSPDVQQQIVTGVLFVWVIATLVALYSK
jgi:hypothetical protein